MSEVQKGLRNFSRPSVLRHNLDSVTDPKYFGTKTSRKQLQEENPLGTAFADSPERSNSNSPSLSEGSSIEEDEVEEKALSPDEEKGGSEDEQSNLQGNQEAKSHEKELSTTIRQRRDEDRKKGKVVTKQLVSLAMGLACFVDLTIAIRVFGTVYSTREYVYKNLSRHQINSFW
jgi:hypothetical protein